MAIKSDQVTVTTERVAIHTADDDGAAIRIRVSGDCYIGNGEMTVESGFLLEKDEIFDMFVGPGEVLYAVVETDSVTLYYVMSLNQ